MFGPRRLVMFFFFFNDTATTEIYTLSLHDALPICSGGRLLVGQGQKSGVYHVLDARTGEIVWQTILNKASGEGGAGGQEGIQWGTSYDGERIYASTNQGNPGTLFALDPATGHGLWRTPSPPEGCTTGGAAASRPGDCTPSLPAAVSTTPGLVFEGSRDGKMRVY